MHKIASELTDYDCFFSLLYSNNVLIKFIANRGLVDTTVLGRTFKKKADEYLLKHQLRNDYARKAYSNKYDLAVLCSDMLVPNDLRKLKMVWVQEGMTDPLTAWAKLIHGLKLPPYLALNTAFNGCSDICDIYCAASEGYKEKFVRS
ncbi:MAG: hypothetical protein ABIS01_15440, partial [Ferruginibacter sp.]